MKSLKMVLHTLFAMEKRTYMAVLISLIFGLIIGSTISTQIGHAQTANTSSSKNTSSAAGNMTNATSAGNQSGGNVISKIIGKIFGGK